MTSSPSSYLALTASVDKIASDLGIGPIVKYVDSHVVVSSFVPGDTLTEEDVHGKPGGRYGEGRRLCKEVGGVIRKFHDLSGTDLAPRIGEGGWLYSLKKVRGHA